MGTWSVSTSGENYIMEYSNGFKRSIRKSQVTKTSKGAIVTYASSQSPNLTLAETIYSIQSYTALTSTIDFTNNGGDDWDVTFKITPDNTQLPSGVTIVDYDYIVDFWNSGVQTQLQNADNVNIDTSVNVGSNGAGVYSLQQHYNLSDGTNLYIWDLIKVDASGNVLDYVKLNGTIVNSVNGLTVNVTANMTQSQSYPVEWGASPSFSTIGSGVSASLSVPIGSNYILYGVVLGAEFSDFKGSPFFVRLSVFFHHQ